MQRQDIPAFQLGDQPQLERVPTDLTSMPSGQVEAWKHPKLPDVTSLVVGKKRPDAISRAIETHLRNNLLCHPEFRKWKFCPPKLFDHLFGPDTVSLVVEELIRKRKSPLERKAELNRRRTVLTGLICGDNKERIESRRLLALLLLVEEEDRIIDFIDRRFTDESLPLDENHQIFHGWEKKKNIDVICDTYQWQFKVPFFALTTEPGTVTHLDLSELDIKPWITPSKEVIQSGLNPEPSIADLRLQDPSLVGGFGEVRQILIHPWQHEFRSHLKSVSLLLSWNLLFHLNRSFRTHRLHTVM